MSGDKIVRVTNQGELDEALKADPSDDVVIVIDSDPGKRVPIYIFVMDSRGHAIEACGRVEWGAADGERPEHGYRTGCGVRACDGLCTGALV